MIPQLWNQQVHSLIYATGVCIKTFQMILSDYVLLEEKVTFFTKFEYFDWVDHKFPGLPQFFFWDKQGQILTTFGAGDKASFFFLFLSLGTLFCIIFDSTICLWFSWEIGRVYKKGGN